jgi:hypothetical protein
MESSSDLSSEILRKVNHGIRDYRRERVLPIRFREAGAQRAGYSILQLFSQGQI